MKERRGHQRRRQLLPGSSCRAGNPSKDAFALSMGRDTHSWRYEAHFAQHVAVPVWASHTDDNLLTGLSVTPSNLDLHMYTQSSMCGWRIQAERLLLRTAAVPLSDKNLI